MKGWRDQILGSVSAKGSEYSTNKETGALGGITNPGSDRKDTRLNITKIHRRVNSSHKEAVLWFAGGFKPAVSMQEK